MRHLNTVVFLRYFEIARIGYRRELMEAHDPVNRGANGFGVIFASLQHRLPIARALRRG